MDIVVSNHCLEWSTEGVYGDDMNEVSAICETAQWNPETGRQNLVHKTYRKMKGMNSGLIVMVLPARLEKQLSWLLGISWIIVQSNCTLKLALRGYYLRSRGTRERIVTSFHRREKLRFFVETANWPPSSFFQGPWASFLCTSIQIRSACKECMTIISYFLFFTQPSFPWSHYISCRTHFLMSDYY